MKDRELSRIRASRSGDIVSGSGHLAHEVAFLLKPGEHFVLEMWHAPSAMRLARDFAVIQTIAQRAAAGRADLAAAVKEHFPEKEFEGPGWDAFHAKLDLIAKGGREGWRYVGLAGGVVPGTAILHALGTAIHEAMLWHPVHEIAAVRRIELVHAVNRPSSPPVIRTLQAGRDPFPAARRIANAAMAELGIARREDLPQPIRAVRPATLDQPIGDDAKGAIAAGSKHLMLTGEVGVDLEEVDTVEITARCVSPDSAIFDDPGLWTVSCPPPRRNVARGAAPEWRGRDAAAAQGEGGIRLRTRARRTRRVAERPSHAAEDRGHPAAAFRRAENPAGPRSAFRGPG